jgi:hypothetical protein
MMQVVSKWKIKLTSENGEICVTINNNFLSNILRKLADIEFGINPTRIEIDLIKMPVQEGYFQK